MIFNTDPIDLGDVVFLITDPQQIPRIVTNIEFELSGAVIYSLGIADSYSMHSEHEFNHEPNVLNALFNNKTEEKKDEN